MEIRQFRITLKARRFEASRRFYGEILGLPQVRAWQGDSERGALFQAGGGFVELRGRAAHLETAERDEAFDYQGPSHKLTLTLVVASAEQAYERLLLRDRNIPGGLTTEAGGGLCFETHDPDGVKVRLREPES